MNPALNALNYFNLLALVYFIMEGAPLAVEELRKMQS